MLFNGSTRPSLMISGRKLRGDFTETLTKAHTCRFLSLLREFGYYSPSLLLTQKLYCISAGMSRKRKLYSIFHNSIFKLSFMFVPISFPKEMGTNTTYRYDKIKNATPTTSAIKHPTSRPIFISVSFLLFIAARRDSAEGIILVNSTP